MLVGAASTRRQSRPTSASAPLSSRTPRRFLSRPVFPFSFLGAASGSEQSSPSTFHWPSFAAPDRFPRALSCATSPRSSSSPPQARSSPYSGRIELRPPSVVAAHRSSAPLDELLPPAFPRAKRAPGEIPRDLLLLPVRSPFRFRHYRRRSTAAPPRNAPPPPRARRRTSLGAAPRRCRAP